MRAATAWACALAALLAFVPAPVVAVPVGSPEEIAETAALEAAARAELLRMREDLDAEMLEHITLTREMEWTRVEISEVSTQTLELEQRLSRAETLLEQRVIESYKGGTIGLFDLVLSATSAQDFLAGAEYLLLVSQRDAALMDEVRRLRSESAWQEESLRHKLGRLTEMQVRSEQQQKRIEENIEKQQARARELGSDLAKLLRERPVVVSGGVPSGFNPDTLMSDATFRASGSMTLVDIQAFLDRQPGTLKSYRARDYAGRDRTVAEMIAEASSAWNVNPKVILVTLQKEQSLLAKANPTQRDYDWAMGCGKTDSATYEKYRGIGNQIWFGAKTLNNNALRFTPGVQLAIDGSPVRPTNAATFTQYRYTPHLKGVMSFWQLYWGYFGNPNV